MAATLARLRSLERFQVRMLTSVAFSRGTTPRWRDDTPSTENFTVFSRSSWVASARREAASAWLSSLLRSMVDNRRNRSEGESSW